MKRIRFSILFITLGFCISCGVYDLSRWENVDEHNYPIYSGVYDKDYKEPIDKARAYAKDSPERINVPSFSVAVGIDNKIIWSEAVGYSDLKNRTSATTESPYRIGSTSKAVTSTLSARLFERGVFDLDKNLNGFITNYPSKQWGFNARHLLSHTAGLPDYKDLKLSGLYRTLCNCKDYESVTEGLDVFNKVDLQFEPGSQYYYNSFDIVLLSAYIEQITGRPFLEVLENEMTKPLGMTHTFGDKKSEKEKIKTVFYESVKDHKFREWKTFSFLYNDINLSYKWAGGGLISTPTDLVKMGNKILNDTTYISSETKSLFFEHQKLTDGSFNQDNYALGWRTDNNYTDDRFNNPQWIVHHGGVSKGSMNFLVLFPEHNLVIDAAINARAENFGYLWGEVMQIASYFINDLESRP